MKLVTFEARTPDGKGERLGVLLDGKVVDLNAADPSLPAETVAFLDLGAAGMEKARFVLKAPPASAVSLEKDIRLKAPLKPRALRDFYSYEDHFLENAKRSKRDPEPEWYHQPLYYKGNHREIYGPDEEIPWPSYTRRFDFESEIAAIVGKKGIDIPIDKAHEYIAGFTIFNDFSARDIQKNELTCRMGPAKGKDFANGLGPWILTCDELTESVPLKLTTKVNGEIWSTNNTKNRYWSFATMLSHASQGETIYPGDVLGAGTYFQGCGLDLGRWVQPGDLIELEVERLGVLRNTVGKPKSQKHLKYTREQAKAGVV